MLHQARFDSHPGLTEEQWLNGLVAIMAETIARELKADTFFGKPLQVTGALAVVRRRLESGPFTNGLQLSSWATDHMAHAKAKLSASCTDVALEVRGRFRFFQEMVKRINGVVVRTQRIAHR